LNDGPGGAPRVSVVLRTKDRPRLLAEAIASLRAQTTADFETLVLNDGGAIDPGLLEPTPGRGIRVVTPPPPGGRTRALNAGLAAASGRYVAYLDDDDLYKPDHLATLAAVLDGVEEYGAVCSSVEQVAQVRGADGRFHDAGTTIVYGRPFDADRIVFKNELPLIGLMHRRELAAAAGGFDEAFDLYEDWDFLIRLSRVTRLHHVPVVTAVYRLRDDGSNATLASPWLGERAQAARLALFEKHAALRTPEAIMRFVDALDREAWTARGEIARLSDDLLLRGRERNEAREHAARLEADLAILRDESARAAEVARERDALADALAAVHNSLWWRLATPWWKLKSLLGR
jgi:glycosyltransferase involved in cell wall biosynthesis